ncbi:adenosylhomocysteinase [Microbacterium sp. USHLN186]|uniref:adenosylhomocysteinase n=1 Tax=Microbacterium sp. USHLN186 TaxID=3081286 RepID=UPI003017F6D3
MDRTGVEPAQVPPTCGHHGRLKEQQMENPPKTVQGDAVAGRAQIEWVRKNSPVLDGFVRERIGRSLQGVRIAVVVHLEAKTAFLATVLADAGAEVIAAGSNPRTTRADVVAALRERGITVVAEEGGDIESWEAELLAAADHAPDYVIDDGAELTMRMLRHRPELFARLRGVSEETTTGTGRLHALQTAGSLPFPALTANDARCKHLFDNRFGTGQTTIQALLRLTNRQIAGAVIVVVGYGYVGRGIAEYAKAMGAQSRVIETDPVRALEALMDGHAVGPARQMLPGAGFVVTATGGMRAIGAVDLPHLDDDVVLANAGHHDLEVDVEAIAAAASATSSPRPGVDTYTVDGRDLHVLTGGALVNIAGGSGHPVEIMDLTFAVQGLGAHHLITSELEPGVHVIPRELDDAIAAAKLASRGVVLDAHREDQTDDAAQWLEQPTTSEGAR